MMLLLSTQALAAPADPPAEAGTVAVQLAAGLGVALVVPAWLAALPDDDSVGTNLASTATLLAAPLLVGATVCYIGNRSAYHEAGCGWPIVMSYAGALSILPLMLIGAEIGDASDDGRSDDSSHATLGAVLGLAIGWLVVQPLAATLSFHSHRRPRAPADVAFERPAGFRALASAAGGDRRSLRAPGQVLLPALSLSF